VSVDGDRVILTYVGKASVPHVKSVEDAALAKVIAPLLGPPPDARVFEGSASRLNTYVRKHTGGTIKDFRTFHANRIFVAEMDALAKAGAPQKVGDRVTAAATVAAEALGHKVGKSRSHFVKTDEKADRMLIEKHGGALFGADVAGFHGTADRKRYQAELGRTAHKVLPKAEHPPNTEWELTVTTALDKYIDPSIVEEFTRKVHDSRSEEYRKLAKGDGPEVVPPYGERSKSERSLMSVMERIRRTRGLQ
jgi:hypothetical protein